MRAVDLRAVDLCAGDVGCRVGVLLDAGRVSGVLKQVTHQPTTTLHLTAGPTSITLITPPTTRITKETT